VGGDAGDAPPSVVRAARACVASYVKVPNIDRWATRLGDSIEVDALRKGDNLFVERLVDCAAHHGIKVDVAGTGGGTRQIDARRIGTGAVVPSDDRAFLACADSAEKEEREMLARLADEDTPRGAR